MKNIPQANQIAGFESSTGQTKKSLAAGHQTTANFGGSVISAGSIHVHDPRRVLRRLRDFKVSRYPVLLPVWDHVHV
jgi:hypothetical protein